MAAEALRDVARATKNNRIANGDVLKSPPEGRNPYRTLVMIDRIEVHTGSKGSHRMTRVDGYSIMRWSRQLWI